MIRINSGATGAFSRFVFAMAAALASVAADDWRFVLGLVGILMLALVLWGVQFESLIKIALPVVIMALFLFLLHLFSHSGRQIFSFLFLTATVDGALQGVLYGLKLFAFAGSACLVIFAVDPFRLIQPLERLARHLGRAGRPLYSILLSFSLALRFLPEFATQAKATLLAFKSRGIVLEGGLIQKSRVAAQLLGTTFVFAFKRAETASMALQVKGYSTRIWKAAFPPATISARSILLLLCAALIIWGGYVR